MKNLVPQSLMRGLMFPLFLGALLFQINCTGIVSNLDQYSGETLYESAVESDGDLLSFAPNIASSVQKHLKTEKQEQAFKEFQHDFMKRLIKENPGFADEFYDKMHSEDREQINQALADGGKLIERELRKLTGEDKVTAENVVGAVLEDKQVK